MQTNQLF